MRSSLYVGGIEVEVIAPRGPLEDSLLERYGPFLGAIDAPVCTIELQSSGTEHALPNPPMAKLLPSNETGTVIRFRHPDFKGMVDLDGPGVITTATNPYTIDHFFRLLFALLAPRHEAVMLHACGVITEGRAHVFAGESGAGKSTLASLAGHRPLLSDEHVMVRRRGSEWIGASTPFWGSYAKPGPARQAVLGRLWSLEQRATNAVVEGDAMDCVRVVLNNAVLPSAAPDHKAAVFPVAVDIAETVPTSVLRFTPDESVWEEIDGRVFA